MARPTVYKRGAMTAAERQRRHRKNIASTQRKSDQAAAHARTRARQGGLAAQYDQLTKEFSSDIWNQARQSLWNELFYRRPLWDAEGAADECARQIAEFLAQADDVSIDDIRAAIDRRFGEQC